MALKKSELYSSLWQSCDELRGGMDASQYKDYVLVFLFLKYVSDKYAGKPFAEIRVPPGASFKDMVALKGKSDIGDQINKTILAPLAKANQLYADKLLIWNPGHLPQGWTLAQLTGSTLPTPSIPISPMPSSARPTWSPEAVEST